MNFQFKKFTLAHDKSTMKIGTDAVLLAASVPVDDALQILDVGCGCGVIAFCMAQKLAKSQSEAQIWGIDPDADSIAEAIDNAEHFPLLPTQSFHFLNVTVQTMAQMPIEPFDLIVSNPPFYHDDLKPVQPNKLKSKHGDNRLSFNELINSVVKLLHTNGKFVLILSKTEGEEFLKAAESQLFCYQRIEIQPTPQKPVHRLILFFAKSPVSEIVTQKIIIRDQDSHYTEEYRDLTKHFLITQK